MPLCFKCLSEKSPDDFYRSHRRQCKACVIDSARKYRADNLACVQAKDRVRGASLERKKEVAKRTKGYNATRDLQQVNGAYPEKRKARSALSNALRDGLISRPEACSCGRRPVQARFLDYTLPPNVEWACTSCHGRKRHEANDEIANFWVMSLAAILSGVSLPIRGAA